MEVYPEWFFGYVYVDVGEVSVVLIPGGVDVVVVVVVVWVYYLKEMSGARKVTEVDIVIVVGIGR